ncbi:methyl-accepting chemotaxis protein [Fluviispira vulneris]|uniref:methyl-accepting chemotaxis protein n=1 Tax=Fluviispira vulneris TaxID=2763012 RepID=UPI0016446FAC|nr:cache domain-containing protein [Fluviispira vulneris]
MFDRYGIKVKILLNCLLSVMIFFVFLVWLSNFYWNVLLETRKERIKNIVDIGYTLSKGYVELEKKGLLTHEEAQKRLMDNIKSIRYSESEYIFIADTRNYLVVNPSRPDLFMKDMSDFKDPTGFKIYIKITEIAKTKGEGFLSYMWPKIGSNTPIEKIAYVKLIPEWNWIVGTGLYLDDVLNSLKKFIEILLVSFIFCVAALLSLGLYFANSVVKPLMKVSSILMKNSEALTHKSKFLSESSQKVQSFSKDQEASIQSTASAISEITSMIAKTTEFSMDSARSANEISKKVEQGENSIKSMQDSMQKIKESSFKLKNIEKIFNEIEIKTKDIKRIVAKTELLSLNASIEAARAGETGKGFSVVALEVGNLAQMSGKASNEIQHLLNRSRKDVDGILQETIENVSVGEQRTSTVSDSFPDIVNGILGINTQMGQISDAIKEQEIGVRQISTAMSQLNDLALKNSSESEKSLRATEDIAKVSEVLKDNVEKSNLVIQGAKKKD